MWNGVFAKHRDYRHADFFSHIMDNGGSYEIDQAPVRVKYRPLDAKPYNPSDRYYFVDFTLGHGDDEVYEFLIHAETDLSEPNENRIRDEFNAIMGDPIIGNRDWWDYLDFDSEETLAHERVQRRLEANEPIPMGPPRQRRKSDYENEDDEWLDSLI